MRKLKAGGGWPAIWYALKKSREAGGVRAMYRALRSRNACKTCALGMGGQRGGMVNERGRFPEVCKKSIQAQAADMRGRISETFFGDFRFEELRAFTPRELEAAGRITAPLYAGTLDQNYRAIEWEDALDRIATKLAKTPPDESFFYFSGRSSNEAGFLLQLFARVFGTNNINNCSYYCHQASGVGLTSVTGSGTATVTLEDVENCDLLFLIGGNPASNHPRLMRTLVEMKRRGGKVIVINPLKELGLVRFRVPSDVRSLFFGSTIADEYVQPHIGGDIALLGGIARYLLDAHAINREFIDEHTDGWPEFREWVSALDWKEIEDSSGVPRRTIKWVARRYIESKSTIFAWTMGITHHAYGVENVQMIANLALMRGMLGRPGAGLLPLRGHSNVQGMGSIGATPALKQAIFERLETRFGIDLPTTPGMDTLACIQAAAEGRIRFAWHLGGNLFGSNPDSKFAAAALSQIDMTVFLSTALNTGHVFGRGRETVILPVLARDEESEATTQESMFNYVRLSDGGESRYDGPRSEVEVIADVAQRTFGKLGKSDLPLDWETMRQHRRIREAIARVVPGYEAIGDIDETKKEFHILGRILDSPQFPTATGRARFHVMDVPSPSPLPTSAATYRENEGLGLRLMTIRSEGQFNTVVYEDQDIYRGTERRDVILMNRADIDAIRLKTGDTVTVLSETGSLTGIVVHPVDIRRGNAAMYYPEANVIVPRSTDKRSHTPAFKNVGVLVVPGNGREARETDR